MIARRPGARQSRRMLPGAALFVPTMLPNCVLWLRGDLGITPNGGAVSGWADQSGHANNASQATPANQPTYNSSDANYNNRPTLSFSGASTQFMTLSALFPAQPMTVYVVGESSSGAVQEQFFGDSTNNVCFYWNGSVWTIFAGTALASANSTRTKQAFGGVFNGAGSALYINTTSSAAVSGNAGATNPAGSEAIGAEAGPLNPLTGKIAEVAVYNVAHAVAQVSQLFHYFGARYGGAWS